VIRNLLILKKELAEMEDSDKHTPLSLAISADKHCCSKIIIFSKINLNKGGGEFGSCLGWAIAKQSYYLTLDLLKQGADPNKCDFEGNTPLHYLFSLFSRNVYENSRIFQSLLRFKAKPNTLTKDKYSALHLAVKKGDIAAVKLAFDHNLTIKNNG
jgi:ankyrin repeat protein